MGVVRGKHYRQSNKRASYSMDLLQTKRFTPGMGIKPAGMAASVAAPTVPRQGIIVQRAAV